MIFDFFNLRRRWFSVLWMLTLLLSCQIFFTSCNAAKLKTEAATVSQIVLSTLNDPKTFNPALNQEFPSIFLFAFDGLTRENGVTGAIEPAFV